MSLAGTPLPPHASMRGGAPQSRCAAVGRRPLASYVRMCARVCVCVRQKSANLFSPPDSHRNRKIVRNLIVCLLGLPCLRRRWPCTPPACPLRQALGRGTSGTSSNGSGRISGQRCATCNPIASRPRMGDRASWRIDCRHAQALGEVQGQRVRPLRQVRPLGRRALEPPRANACMCMWRQHLVPGPQRARRQQSRPQSPSTGCIKF